MNAGMSEQHIIGMAAGLALEGMKVFVYSIVPFITLRCFEQIKVDVCYHNTDVTIIGAGGGFAYGAAGGTHYAIEDIAALRALPRMKVIVPSSPWETRMLMPQIIAAGGPTYLRIGRGKEIDFGENEAPTLGRSQVLRKGSDATIFFAGPIGKEALDAAEILKQCDLDVEVISMHTIKPIDRDAIALRAGNRRAIFTLEEHSVLGGLGSAVAEILAELPEHPVFLRFGVQDTWPVLFGSQTYLRNAMGISAMHVAEKIKKVLL